MIEWKKPSEHLPEDRTSYLILTIIEGTDISSMNVGYPIIEGNNIIWRTHGGSKIKVDYYAEVNLPDQIFLGG